MSPRTMRLIILLMTPVLIGALLWGLYAEARADDLEAEGVQLRTSVGALEGRNETLDAMVKQRDLAMDEWIAKHHDQNARADRAEQRVAELEAKVRTLETQRASRSATRTPSPKAEPVAGPVTGRTVSSTAYCLTGTMSNGEKAHKMAVAVPQGAYPLNSYVVVSDGPYGAGRYKVADHIGHSSQLDFAMPGDCSGAKQWGRRQVTVRAA